MKQSSPVALIILDGFGYSPSKDHNAITSAHTPHLNAWFKQYPHAFLQASGKAVGLPEGYIGNSEVGHMTIGAGKRITQPITILNNAIADGSFFKNPVLNEKLQEIAKKGSRLHIMGLISDAGIHSQITHLAAFLQAAAPYHLKKIYIHAFLDGRDVAPRSAAQYLTYCDQLCKQYPNVYLGSLHGRFYAMDRDKNWDRTEECYRVLTQQQPFISHSWQATLAEWYERNVRDEFIPPTQLDPDAIIRDGDGIIFLNTRPDRARQLTECFINRKFNAFPIKHLDLACFITPVSYASYLPTDVLFHPQLPTSTLKDKIVAAGKRIFSIAETEKYAHITYFFDAGREQPFPHEKRVLIPSILADVYVDHPSMSAPQITKAVLESLAHDPYDFYLINYANADMVGHSGNFDATVMAIECLDRELAKLYTAFVEDRDGIMFITADHGKAEDMFDSKSNQSRTAHTTNPVPFLMLEKGLKPGTLPLKELADIADFILKKIQ